MDDWDQLGDPGTYAADAGSIENLEPDYDTGGTIGNLLPELTQTNPTQINPVDDDFNSFIEYEEGGGDTTGSTPSLFGGLTGNATGLFNALGTAGNSLLNAFVTNPANAQTQAGTAFNNAEISTAETSQIFGYLVIGLVIFLIFGLFEKK